MISLSLTQQIAVSILPLLTAITLHEAAHAFVANWFGDTTAKAQGRLTLNPINHIDPMGTIIIPILIAVMSQFTFLFGWAKPVPVTPSRLKNPRRDMILVTLAGPFSNFFMAFLWGLLLKACILWPLFSDTTMMFLVLTARMGIIMNLVLGFFNILPIPPLDGSKVIAAVLPYRYQNTWYAFERWGFLVILLLLYTGVISLFLSPLMNQALSIFQSILHI